LRKAKNINKWYIVVFFSAAKIKPEEKTQAKNTCVKVCLKAANLEKVFYLIFFLISLICPFSSYPIFSIWFNAVSDSSLTVCFYICNFAPMKASER